MPEYNNIVVLQTAFLGAVILTLPLVQSLKHAIPGANIDVIVVPRAAELLKGHADIRNTIVYDKRGMDRGIPGFLRLRRLLRRNDYDLALIPHRSVRSALLAALSSIPRRIGFDKSSGRFLYTDIVHYEPSQHEVDRNLRLLAPLNIVPGKKDYPHLSPSPEDRAAVDRLLGSVPGWNNERIIGLAPGTIWNTKRWLTGGFIGLAKKLQSDGYHIALIGGEADTALCDEVYAAIDTSSALSAAGKLTLLQSAELIRRCRLVVSNDSAPMHLAVAMQTPVVAIFGATVPEFGFGPYGNDHAVVETKGLPCRPCSIHGGDVCPISTFECMKRITDEDVYRIVQATFSGMHASKKNSV